MKKNKGNAYWYKENLNKYRARILIFNLSVFILVFFIFCFVFKIVVEQTFYYNVQREILTYNEELNRQSPNKVLSGLKNEDPRITVVYYLGEYRFNGHDQNPEFAITEYRVFGPMDDDLITPCSEIANEPASTFKQTVLSDFTYMSYVSKQLYRSYDLVEEKEVVVCYVKIYMNIENDIESKDNLNTSLVLTMLLIMILSYISSHLIMISSTRPLKDFVDKQVAFVSDASHELRTPLAIVQSKIENILANPSQSVTDVSEDLAISLKEIARLNKLTADLLALARSDQNRLTYNLEKINLHLILTEIIEPFIEIAGFESRSLTYTGVDVDVLVDKDKIRELMIILLDNALKYTNENDVIKVTLKVVSSDVIIEVSDTGIGINEESKKRIFERFYREDKNRSRETGGNGLGLSLAKTIVTELKGKIYVDHNEPKGTVFTIYLPRAK